MDLPVDVAWWWSTIRDIVLVPLAAMAVRNYRVTRRIANGGSGLLDQASRDLGQLRTNVGHLTGEMEQMVKRVEAIGDSVHHMRDQVLNPLSGLVQRLDERSKQHEERITDLTARLRS